MKKKEINKKDKNSSLLNKAEEHLDKSEYTQAEKLLQKIIEAESIHFVNIEKASTLWRSAVEDAEKLGDKALLARALQKRGDIYRMQGNLEQADTDFAYAVEFSKGRDSRVQMLATCGRGIVARYQGRWYDAKEKYLSAIVLAQERKDQGSEATYYTNLGTLAEAQGDIESAAKYHANAVRIASAISDKKSYAQCLNHLANFCLNAGDSITAHAYLDEAYPIIVSSGDRIMESFLYRNLGNAFLIEENYEQAMVWTDKAVNVSRELGGHRELLFALKFRGFLHYKKGDVSSGLRDLEEALEYAKEKEWECDILSYSALVSTIAGSTSKAENFLEKCEELINSIPESLKPETFAIISETKNLLGDKAGAYEALHQSVQIQKHVYSAKVKNEIGSMRLLLKIEREEHEKEMQKMRVQYLEDQLSTKAIAFASQTELISNFREDLRRIIRKIETRDPAINELIAKLRELPDGVDWKEFEEQFRQVHPEFSGKLLKKYPGLTEIELRVAALLRLKLKTPDIARLLSLSDRTIDNHRHRIRKKLGLDGSVDFAKFLAAY